MGHGAFTYFSGSIASAGTLSEAIDLGRSWSVMTLDIPARSNTTLYLQVSPNGSSFKRIYNAASRAGAETVFQIASATTGVAVPIPPGHRYVKIESQDAISNGMNFTISVSDLGSRNG
jgi:hypothetical protein